MQRLRPLSEQECYLRCYGRSGDETVKLLPAGDGARRDGSGALSERIRLAFEARLDARESEAA